MEKVKEHTNDWLRLAQRSLEWEKNQTGWLAELRRVPAVNVVADRPAYYRLIQGILPPGKAAERAAFILPWLSHREDTLCLGAQFRQARISEMRLFQMIRSDVPRDIELLRRLVQQLKKKPAVDWKDFGLTMQYWGKGQKRKLAEQYFLFDPSEQEKKG